MAYISSFTLDLKKQLPGVLNQIISNIQYITFNIMLYLISLYPLNFRGYYYNFIAPPKSFIISQKKKKTNFGYLHKIFQR